MSFFELSTQNLLHSLTGMSLNRLVIDKIGACVPNVESFGFTLRFFQGFHNIQGTEKSIQTDRMGPCCKKIQHVT